MSLRTWRPKNPVLTATVTVAVTYVTARAFGVSKRAAVGLSTGAFVAHDRWVDGEWPFNKAPFNRVAST